ncbi:MAG: sigma-54-dependent Fis family transcriptional regulator [Rhodospirillales bacterium]|jgi:transcriptional regulator of acetoin/glycerol metabolism|nr:sigma-54-dependent Fis family transcriptional regulator [Rhodospirillales bacterium]
MPYDIDRHAQHITTAVESNGAAYSSIVASWRRCMFSYGLDPGENASARRSLSGTELREARQRLEPLLYTAEPTLNRLRTALPSMGCSIIIADLDGVSVHWSGNDTEREDARRLGLSSGIDWSERHEGTNGIGTCLVEKQALSVREKDHFLARDTELSCSVAPIFDHQGQMTAALDLAYFGNASSEALIGLLAYSAREAAYQIEAANFVNVFSDSRIIAVSDHVRACAGLLAVDEDDVVIGATRMARSLLGITDNALRNGISAMDLRTDTANLDDTIARAERGTIRRALVRTGRNVSASAKALNISRATIKRKMKQHNLHRLD